MGDSESFKGGRSEIAFKKNSIGKWKCVKRAFQEKGTRTKEELKYEKK